jgi:hypothetical protein
MQSRALRLFAALTLLIALAGCDLLGIEPASALAQRKEAEGKAVGGACRHAGRAIEDCYALNRKAEKAAVFAGWREMNDYMRENKIDTVTPQAEVDGAGGSKAEGEDAQAAASDKPAKSGKAQKPAAKAAKSDKADKAPKDIAAKH